MSDVFPKAGVKMSFVIGEFLDILGGRGRLEGLTTGKVREDIIIPLTRNTQSSYCDIGSSRLWFESPGLYLTRPLSVSIFGLYQRPRVAASRRTGYDCLD